MSFAATSLPLGDRQRGFSPPATGAAVLSVLAMAVASLGCRLGPDPARPDNAARRLGEFTQGDAVPLDGETLTRRNGWWRRIGDEATRRLVEQVMQANPDARAAAARVLAAKGRLRSAEGRLWPGVEGGATARRQKQSFTLPPPAGRVTVTNNNFDLGLEAGWQVDLWGRLRRSEQAAWASLLAGEAERDALLHTLAAQAVRGRVRLDTLRRRLALVKATTANRRRTLDAVERRLDAGLAEAVDVRLARQNVASARARAAPLEQALVEARHALDVLRGQPPGRGTPIRAELEGLPGASPPPVGMPAALLDRRPDLRASEMRARARTAEIGVAIADLFPTLTLNGGAGLNANELGELIASESFVYSLVADVSAPILTAGVERGEIETARAEARAAAADYAALVLRALREVEDALSAERTARRNWALTRDAVEQADAAERLARERYARGVGELLTVLEAERRGFTARRRLLEARQSAWDARIDLHLALGGDWGLKPPPPPPVPSKELRAERDATGWSAVEASETASGAGLAGKQAREPR